MNLFIINRLDGCISATHTAGYESGRLVVQADEIIKSKPFYEMFCLVSFSDSTFNGILLMNLPVMTSHMLNFYSLFLRNSIEIL